MNDTIKALLLIGGMIAAGIAVNVIAIAKAHAKPPVAGVNCPETLPHCIGPRGSVTKSGPIRGRVNGHRVSGQFSMTLTKKAKAKKIAKAKPAKRKAVKAAPGGGTGGGTTLVSAARRYIGMTAAQIGVRRTLWCAAFLNKITGGGTGSDLARSWANRPRITPQVGAVAVMSRGRRGGHVGIVSGFDSRGNPIIISGNHGRRVAESVYPRGRIYAWVRP